MLMQVVPEQGQDVHPEDITYYDDPPFDDGNHLAHGVAARYIKNGVVKFLRIGCEQLIRQLLGFGVEKHDDSVDALVYLILGLAGDGIEEQKVHYV
jgi:hypothetical protein